MKNYNKNLLQFLLGILLFGVCGDLSAQCDPRFSGSTYTGTSVQGGIATVLVGETGQLKFSFGVGPVSTCNAAAGNAAGAITLTITFPTAYYPSSAADISGVDAALYNWVWDPVARTLVGVNNTTITPGGSKQFIVNVKGKVITAGTGAPLTTLKFTSTTTPPITNSSGSNDGASAGLNVDAGLPVTLVSFKVTNERNSAYLEWATTEETNSDRFEVERSTNAKKWNLIGTVSSNGESKVLRTYTFADVNPSAGTNYYRLKMIDQDATFAYSSIRSNEFANGKMLSVYPNPVSSVLFLQDAAGVPVDAKSVKEVSIVNASGITAYKSNSVSAAGINVTSLTSGMYVVKVTKTDGSVSSHNMVIVK